MGTDRQTGPAGEQKLERTPLPNVVAEQIAAGTALAQLSTEIPDRGTGEQAATVRRIPIEIDVSVPIRRFQVRDVLALNEGQVIVTRWVEGEDMPLAAHGTQLAWAEIEVIDQKLAVRLTRLA
jgi:flagellar motor switch/type III secretory pathway protein FliN